MPKFTYTGDAAQTYPQYLDAETGLTLVAQPGETYNVAQVEGLTVPGENDAEGNPTVVEVKLAMPPDDRWTEPKAAKPARRTDVTNEEN